ncbi:hypothetical protein [Exiguobacterium sp. s144]|uniref:hypothetical protein n=1 Tax=Exiguobacterium sp. s144 TaxID=2751195 RepID=UPI001BE67D5D|nr:hypothetical protein [Exiguobacterium sp. s144]
MKDVVQKSTKKTKELTSQDLKKMNVKELISSLPMVFAFFIIGSVVLLLPNYLGNILATEAFGFLLIFIGLLGLANQLNNLNKQESKLINPDFAIGFVLILVWIFTYHVYNDPLLNFLFAFVLLLGVYAILRFFSRLILEIFENKDRQSAIRKGILLAVQFFGSLATLYEAFEKVGTLFK